MVVFIDMCIRNGITFELRKKDGEKAGDVVVDSSPFSETDSVSNDNPSPIQSPSDKENASKDACEAGCEEPQKRLTRITLDNWRELLEVSSEVISFSEGKKDWTVQWVTTLEDSDHDLGDFMELNGTWVYFEDDSTCENGREYYVEK